MTGLPFRDYFRGFLITLMWFSTALAQHEIKDVDGLKVMLGVASVEEIKKHPDEHPEIKMHGGPKGTHHILVHIEDEKTGKVVSDASVQLTVHNPDGTKVTRPLEPMTIGGITDFGDYFDLRYLGNYHIDVFITPKEGDVKKATFVYERRPGH